MTRPTPPSTFRRARPGARSSAWLAAAAALAAAWPATAAAQACCAGGALVNPTRLAPYEDAAAGLQARVRGQLGSFSAEGDHAAAANEQDFEQDLAASIRVARRTQVGLVLPFVETRRTASGQASLGGGLGDLALTARHDFTLASEMLRWPGVALLASVVFPTGQAAGSGTNAAGTDATGTGTLSGSLGVAFETVHGPIYGALQGWLTVSGSRTVDTPGFGATTTDFPVQVNALAVAGYVFQNEAAAALYVSFLTRGDVTVDGAKAPGTELRLTTAGASGLLPVGERWRLQGTVFADLPWPPLGVNEQTGLGGTVALVHLWM
jgi:hypothetical protein